MMRTGEALSLLGLLLVAGVAAWWLMLRPVVEPDPARLDALPLRLMDYQAMDIPMDRSVSEMLDADHNVQRAYLHPQGYVVFVYVGYYGTRRGGTPEHTPEVCYPSQGWALAADGARRVGGRDGIDVRELVVTKQGEQRLVHFWYRTRERSGITSIAGLRLDHFRGRLLHNRADGALVRVSTPVEHGDLDAARSRLYAMDRGLELALDQVWPGGDESLAGIAR
ncbi:MAG: EpsI family protein [Spirochaetaceae bacterium]|nr:EpsI family protein [Myxococcales bacterium]MCB9725333.1 EpsI family protein [Spirochaetaceae bacterium]